MSEKLLSILVPVYNEAENIGPFLDQVFLEISEPFEILVLYDRYQDNTIEAVHKYLKVYPSRSSYIRLVKNSVCVGASGAIRTGFQEARGSQILVAMADLCDDLSQVKSMRALMGHGYDVVCPSRYCAGGEQKLHSIRAWVPRLVGWGLYLFAGVPCKDATNSYRLYSRVLLRSLTLRSTHSFSVSLEVLAKAHCLGFRIKEIPTVWNARQVGESKFPFLASLVSYLPWFFLALCNNRLFSIPLSWRRNFAKAIVNPPGQSQVPLS